MAIMWFLILSPLALLSQGAYIDSCSYVKTTTDTGASPMIHWGFVYPMDVCMTYVDSGAATYKKYVCNDALEVKEEIWDTDTCDGALSTTQDPIATVEDFQCETYGECEYMRVKYMTSDCSTATTYKEEAIIPDECVNAVIGGKSFQLHCSDQSFNLYTGTTCSGTASNTEDLSSSCQNIGSLTGFGPLSYWDVTSACLSITYASPTSDPTTEPTTEPTIEPTSNPSESPSKNPSETPSESPSESPSKYPSGSPSESPSKNPSQTPSESPTTEPTVEPTANPSDAPSKTPSMTPSADPSNDPTAAPTDVVVDETESEESGASLYITFIANLIIAIVLSLAI